MLGERRGWKGGAVVWWERRVATAAVVLFLRTNCPIRVIVLPYFDYPVFTKIRKAAIRSLRSASFRISIYFPSAMCSVVAKITPGFIISQVMVFEDHQTSLLMVTRCHFGLHHIDFPFMRFLPMWTIDGFFLFLHLATSLFLYSTFGFLFTVPCWVIGRRADQVGTGSRVDTTFCQLSIAFIGRACLPSLICRQR